MGSQERRALKGSNLKPASSEFFRLYEPQNVEWRIVKFRADLCGSKFDILHSIFRTP
jgi:hypothetical protein